MYKDLEKKLVFKGESWVEFKLRIFQFYSKRKLYQSYHINTVRKVIPQFFGKKICVSNNLFAAQNIQN